MVQHFLITRFNLKLKEWKTTKQGESVLSETWLTNRFELFKTYCLPSVKQQTNQNFKWLVCFDSETPDVFKAAINQMAASYSNFQPLYIDGFTDALEAITKTITSYLSASDTHIITTRLDNDDAVHKLFIEKKTGQRMINIKNTLMMKYMLLFFILFSSLIILTQVSKTIIKIEIYFWNYLSLYAHIHRTFFRQAYQKTHRF